MPSLHKRVFGSSKIADRMAGQINTYWTGKNHLKANIITKMFKSSPEVFTAQSNIIMGKLVKV